MVFCCGAFAFFLAARDYTRNQYQPSKIISVSDIERLGIREVITKVQEELRESEKERIRSDKDSLFQVKDFELEIKFVVSTKTSDNQQASLELITLDTKAEYSQEKVHHIRLRMVVPEPKPMVLQPSPSVAIPSEGIQTLGPPAVLQEQK